jgi:hypothetical protein
MNSNLIEYFQSSKSFGGFAKFSNERDRLCDGYSGEKNQQYERLCQYSQVLFRPKKNKNLRHHSHL